MQKYRYRLAFMALAILVFGSLILSSEQAAFAEVDKPSSKQSEVAVFAGGCFWCVESLYQEVEGVTKAVSGFTGGRLKRPIYSGNHRGHWEAVEVTYDPNIVSYQQLLDLYWVNIDPFDAKGQFCDKGPSYRSAIFYQNDAQKELAEISLKQVAAEFSETVHTDILAGNRFWPVEEYHQDYYKKNPIRYHLYRSGCRRDARLEQIWGARSGSRSGSGL